MPTPLTRTLSTLALLLVACAQIFGLQRGYQCHHQAQASAVLTAAEHCHRLSTGFSPCATAHSDHDEEEGQNQDQDQDSERHAPLKVSTTAATATSSLASAAAPAFTAVLLATLPSFDPILVLSGPAAHSLNHPLHFSAARPPPASLQVARCIVLRV